MSLSVLVVHKTFLIPIWLAAMKQRAIRG
jgi:hypothetical protein